MDWTRILNWSFLIYAALLAVGFVSGISMNYWEIYGSTMDAAIENARLVRRIGYWIVAALLYWRFAQGVARHRLMHALMLYLAVQLLCNWIVRLVLGEKLTFDPWADAKNLAVALTGYTLAEWQLWRVRVRRPATGQRTGAG